MMSLLLGRILDCICLIIVDSVDWLFNCKNVFEFSNFFSYILEEKFSFGKLSVNSKKLIRMLIKFRVKMLR